MKASLAALVTALASLAGAQTVSATTPPDDEVTIEDLQAVEESFVETFTAEYQELTEPACSIADGTATCYATAAERVVRASTAWDPPLSEPMWQIAEFIDATTAQATSTTTTTTTAVSAGGNLGVVWASAVDPARINQPPGSIPTFDGGDGIAVRLENVLLLDASGSGDLAQVCRDEIEFVGSTDTQCLSVQLAMDVPAGYGPGEALLTTNALVTPSGRQIDSALGSTGYSGSVDVRLSAVFPGGEPGSSLRFGAGSNDLGFAELEFTLPPLEAFQPINFD